MTIILGLAAGAAHATPPLVLGDTDIVPYKHWEIWTTFEFIHAKNERSYTAPTLEVIYALAPRLEVAVETAYESQREDFHETKGMGFVSLQPKYLLLEEQDICPSIAASLQLEVPTDGDKRHLEWKDRESAPNLRIQKHFGKNLLITNLKYFINSDGETEKWRTGLDYMYQWNDCLKLLAEIYTDNYIKEEKLDEINFRLGFKYKFHEHAKAYFAAGRSLSTVRENRHNFESSGGIMLEF
jgi:hypothetical protein